jgi:hypothetical protein
MYKFAYVNSELENQMNAEWDSELTLELNSVRKILKKDGEIEGASVGINPAVSEPMYELMGKNFRLVYAVFPKINLIKFYEFQPVGYLIDWKTKLDLEIQVLDNEPYILQTGDHKVIANTLKKIAQGENTSYQLGLAVGSKAKKEKDVARRGQYVGKGVVELGLATSVHSKNVSAITYQVTEPIRLAIEREDEDTLHRLIAEAVLGFLPVQRTINETTRGKEELTIELIVRILYELNVTSIGGTTLPRRAQSIRALTVWVSRVAGIPIRRQGQEHVQPYIPFIYATPTI